MSTNKKVSKPNKDQNLDALKKLVDERIKEMKSVLKETRAIFNLFENAADMNEGMVEKVQTFYNQKLQIPTTVAQRNNLGIFILLANLDLTTIVELNQQHRFKLLINKFKKTAEEFDADMRSLSEDLATAHDMTMRTIERNKSRKVSKSIKKIISTKNT